MNKIFLTGRFTSQPELKTTTTGTDVMSFSLAVRRAYSKNNENETDFINCVAWQKTAVFINQYFNKGDGINLVGRLEGKRYIDKDGNNRTAYEVVVDNVEFPLSKSNNNNQSINTQPVATAPTFEELTADEDLPF